jgi:ACS family hexuronate transporter-like MFS transporter
MDRLGERMIIGLFMLLGAAAVLLVAVAPGYLALLGIAVLMGTFRSPGNAAGGRAIIGWVSKKRRATAMGVKQAGSSIYAALAAAGVPILAVAYGWRTAVIVMGVFLALSAAVIYMLYREPETSDERKKRSGSLKDGLIEIMHNKDAGYVMAVSFMLLGTEVTVAVYFISFLHQAHGVSLVAAGGLLAVVQVTSVFTRIAWGSASDVVWKGRRKPALSIGSAATVAVLLALAALPAGIPAWPLFLAAVGLGATARALTPINQTLLAEVTSPGRLGLVLGFSGTVGRSSTFIRPPLFGVLADAVDFRAHGWPWPY